MRRLAMLLILAVLCGLCGCASSAPAVSLRINEVQIAGETDWIEVYNAGDRAVSLGGFFVSDDPDEPGKWQFPDMVLGADEYVVLYADRSATVDSRLSLPFALRSSGETVVISDPNGAPISTVAVPESAPGVSYGCDANGTFVWYASPTPAAANDGGMPMGSQAVNEAYGIRINEYMSRNRSVLYDRDGDYGDWVELYNFSDRDIDIGGYTLTDAKDNTTRWQFPSNTVVTAGGYLVVFCSGKNRADGELHTSFKLGTDDSFLGLYTADGMFCSGVTCQPTDQDTSMIYTANGSYAVCRFPTPGYANAGR